MRTSPPDSGSKAARKPGTPAHHLQHQLADVHHGQQCVHPGPQAREAGGIGETFQLGGVQAALRVDRRVHPRLQPAGDVPQLAVKAARKLGEQLLGVLGQLEGVEHGALHGQPGIAAQQPGPGIRPAEGSGGEDVPAHQGLVELFQQAEDISRPVHGALGPAGGEDNPPPGGRHQVGGDLSGIQVPGGHGNRGAYLHQGRQGGDRLQQGPGLRLSAEAHGLQQPGQEAAHQRVAGHQRPPPLGVGVLVRGGGHLAQVGHGRPDIGLGDGLLDCPPDGSGGQRCSRIDQTKECLHGHRQPPRVPAHVGVAAQGLLPGLAPGPGEQVRGHHQVEDLQGVVDRPGVQVPKCGHEDGHLAGMAVTPQGGRLGGHPVAGQLQEPAWRHLRHRDVPEPESVDLHHAPQRPHHRLARCRRGSSAQPLQPRNLGSLGDPQQPHQLLGLGGCGPGRQQLVELVLGLVVHPGDQPVEGGRPRE